MVIPSAAMDGVENLGESMIKLLESTGFSQSMNEELPFPFANYVMLVVAFVLFYLAMIDEINDEVDDALEDYSETIIINSTIPFSTALFCCSSVTSEGS